MEVNNALMTRNDAQYDAFGAAASALAGGVKSILKFDKGDWVAGQEGTTIPTGTKLAADMFGAEQGWVLWKDGKPADRRMGLVARGAAFAPRETLGYLDEALWEHDDNGRPRDPWVRTIEIPVREIEGSQREFLLAGSSKGFEGACRELFKQFSKEGRMNYGKVPVIQILTDSYRHAKYGKVNVPVLHIAHWIAESELKTAAKQLAELDDDIPF